MLKGNASGIGRRIALMGAAGALAAPFTPRFAHGQQRKRLIVPTYGGTYQEMIKAAFTDPFEKETGVEVVFSGVPDFARLKAQVLAKKVEWDIFEAGGAWFPAGARDGLFEPLDPKIVTPSELLLGPNKEYAPFYDTPYGIAWNSKRKSQAEAPRTCADFWDLKKFVGSRSMRGRADFVLEIALVADGVDPEKLYPLDLDRAFKSLNRLKPGVPKWAESTSQLVTLLTTGEVDFNYLTNGRVRATIDTPTPLSINLDQVFLSHEYIGVVKGSPNKQTAMEFIAFVLRPDRQAAFANLISYLPGNPAALKLINEESRKWLPDTTSHKHIRQDDNWWADNFNVAQQRFQEFLLT